MRNMMGMVGKNMGLMGKIPGLKSIGQAAKMRGMMKNMNPNDLGSMLGGGLPGMGAEASGSGQRKTIDRNKARKSRKAARKARKRNRKR